MPCPHILLTGPRKGKKCGTETIAGSKYCYNHRYKYEKPKLSKVAKKILEESSSSSEEAPKKHKKIKKVLESSSSSEEAPKKVIKTKKQMKKIIQSTESSEEMPKPMKGGQMKEPYYEDLHETMRKLSKEESEDELSPLSVSEKVSSEIIEEEDPFDDKKNSDISDQPQPLSKKEMVREMIDNEIDNSKSESEEEPAINVDEVSKLLEQLDQYLATPGSTNQSKQLLNKLLQMKVISKLDYNDLLQSIQN